MFSPSGVWLKRPSGGVALRIGAAGVGDATSPTGPPPVRQTGPMVRKRVVVRGRVQGVFFRDTCRRRAVEHGVSGWVTNRDDGSVEAVLEGEPVDVEAVLTWCRTGPPRARVSDVTVTDEEPEGEQGFRVRTGGSGRRT